MSAKVTRRNLLEMAAIGGAALSVAVTAAKPALAQDTAPRDNPVGSSSSGRNDYDVFELGDVALQSGITLPRAKLAYKTYGKLTATRDNAVLMPTYYGGRHIDNEAMIGFHIRAGLVETPLWLRREAPFYVDSPEALSWNLQHEIDLCAGGCAIEARHREARRCHD